MQQRAVRAGRAVVGFQIGGVRLLASGVRLIAAAGRVGFEDAADLIAHPVENSHLFFF